ncbi:hypothetical protein [Deinococcus aerophilus]|nr:hypothetical protein [Deinococcus aerophilus]
MREEVLDRYPDPAWAHALLMLARRVRVSMQRFAVSPEGEREP